MKILKYILIILVLVVLAIWVAGLATTHKESTEVENNPPIVGENLEGEADPNRMTLGMKKWNWISALYNDGTEIKPRNADKFTLTFSNDGTFSVSTDCNGIGGNYEVGPDNRITFSQMISTLMFCENSQETEFRNILENAASFFFTSRGELIIEQKFDSGTATFR